MSLCASSEEVPLRRFNEEEADTAFFDGLSVRFEALDLLFSAMNVSESSRV
jgi:hypothetical protein